MRTLFTFALLLISQLIFGQTYLMSDTTITTCSGTFYDTGGEFGAYSNGENITMTICSGDPDKKIKLFFSSFELETDWDYISIYDGIDITAPILVQNASGTSLLNTEIESSQSGCLTIVFTSDGSVSQQGWVADISCSYECQDFTVNIQSVNSEIYNGDTLYFCAKDTINFIASGNYINNNTLYYQDDTTTYFYWDFGDGTDTSGLGLSNVSHTYNGYYHSVSLYCIDDNGCFSLNTENLMLGSYGTPSFANVYISDSICIDDIIDFSGFVDSQTYLYQLPILFNDTTFLPDGSGSTVYVPFSYNQFYNNVILDTPQIESICMDLEYSYAGDLIIILECPNGQQMTLFDGYNSSVLGGEYIGEPTDMSSNMGTPYTYCWSPTSTNGTMEDVGGNPPVYSYLDNDSNQVTNHQYIPGGEYESSGNWSDLTGCPLNGDWQFLIIDNMGADDGYLFSWQINWAQSFTDTLPYFTVTYDENLYNWTGNNIISQNNGVGTAFSDTVVGVENYTFYVTDNYGCVYDTTLQVEIYDCTFIFDNKVENIFSLYPNPAKETINIEFSDNKYIGKQLLIIDSNGKQVKSIEITNNIIHIDIQNLEKGIYLIRIDERNQQFIKG